MIFQTPRLKSSDFPIVVLLWSERVEICFSSISSHACPFRSVSCRVMPSPAQSRQSACLAPNVLAPQAVWAEGVAPYCQWWQPPEFPQVQAGCRVSASPAGARDPGNRDMPGGTAPASPPGEAASQGPVLAEAALLSPAASRRTEQPLLARTSQTLVFPFPKKLSPWLSDSCEWGAQPPQGCLCLRSVSMGL